MYLIKSPSPLYTKPELSLSTHFCLSQLSLTNQPNPNTKKNLCNFSTTKKTMMQSETNLPYRPLTVIDDGGLTLELTPSSGSSRITTCLTIDLAETVEKKIERLIEENPVIIFSRSSCYMCHVMKKLFTAIGVNPTVIELEEGDEEMSAAVVAADHDHQLRGGAPVVFIGGNSIGGLESLMGLHLSGNLVPMLREVGVIFRYHQ